MIIEGTSTMTLEKLIEIAWLEANKEFSELYPDIPVPATMTAGCDIFKAKLLKLIEEID